MQFQQRGSPHTHVLLATYNDGIDAADLTSTAEERRNLVQELVKNTVTCCLKYPKNDDGSVQEKDYLFRPMVVTADPADPASAMEDYEHDVRRLLFPLEQDFRLDENNEFVSSATREQYYQFQLANQMHTCMDTCWKYSYTTDGDRKCRFHYPVPPDRANASACTIFTLYDNKNRKQTKINAPRNNGWVNPLPVRPLLVFANQGNMDLQYISNASGAVEYTCGYISKDEQPDHQTLINIFAKKLAVAIENSEVGDATQRQQLRAAGTAIAASQQVGAVQCVYVMLKLPFVQLSRQVATISSVPTKRLSKNIITDMKQLQLMNPGDSTVSTSAKSHIGRRLSYSLLCQQQYKAFGECRISLFAVVSTYALSKPKRTRCRNGKKIASATIIHPKLLTVDANGKFLL